MSLRPTHRLPAGSLRVRGSALLPLVLAVVPPAASTELIFEPTTQAGVPVDAAYGDRVSATAQDGFLYGAGGGFTPNVTVDYGPWDLSDLRRWTTGYGDLEGVLYDEQDGRGYLEVRFAADAGWRTRLEGFDMAAWRVGGSIRFVRVWNGAGDILFEQTDVDVPTTGHLHFAFDPPLEGRWLTIAFDAGNLGTYSDNIGIDNVRFGQGESPTAVEPESWGRTKAGFR